MIVITGAAGFIASFLAEQFNKNNINDLILVDDFSRKDKELNHKSINCCKKIGIELSINHTTSSSIN